MVSVTRLYDSVAVPGLGLVGFKVRVKGKSISFFFYVPSVRTSRSSQGVQYKLGLGNVVQNLTRASTLWIN